jgi:hypothetical protein
MPILRDEFEQDDAELRPPKTSLTDRCVLSIYTYANVFSSHLNICRSPGIVLVKQPHALDATGTIKTLRGLRHREDRKLPKGCVIVRRNEIGKEGT